LYVDAFHDRKKDVIHIVERVDGRRVYIEQKPIYNFYVADPRGKLRSTHGEPVCELQCRNSKEFRKNLSIYSGSKTFESDIKPLNKNLSKHYYGCESPRLHTAFFDIETAFDNYAYPEDTVVRVRKKKSKS
jgi:hypothetical protein